MPVSFSYEAYPNLFDNIVAEADHATALSLRLTCKALRGAVDRHQARHLVLTPSGKDGTAVRGFARRIPALRRLGPKSLSQKPVHPDHELLQHVRVLDFRGFFPATCNLTLLKNALPALSVVRLCTRKGAYTPYVPVGARTLVLFTSPHGGDCNPKTSAEGTAGGMAQLMDTFGAMFGDGPPQARTFPRGIDPRDLPESVRRIVVNMGGEDYAVAEMYHFVLDPPEHVEEIVIVLPRVSYERGSLRTRPVSQDTFAIKIIAMDLAELMVGIDGVRYTLVGLEAASRTPAVFRKLIRKQLESYRFGDVAYAEEPTLVQKPDGGYDLRQDAKDPAKHEAKVDKILGQLDIVSFDDYAQQVGKAEAVLETVEYEDGTKRGTRPRGVLMNDIRRMGPAAQE